MRKENPNIYIALLLAIVIFSLMTILAYGENNRTNFPISAHSATLYEPETDIFLYSKNADERMPMASTTKIMTALVALEASEMQDLVIVDERAVGTEGSSAYLLEGDVLTMEELLYALLLQSANDAAVAIACHIGGDIEGFARLMNLKADELSLCNTHFVNPHGLDDEDHYTTASELAKITAAALQNETFRKITSTYKRTFATEYRSRTYVNHNKLLKSYDGCIGVKTGFTTKSGRCLVSAAEREGLTFISVTLDAPNDWRDHTRLLNLGFDTLEKIKLTDELDHSYMIPIVGGMKEHIKVANLECANTIAKKGDATVSEHIKLVKYAVAPISEGDILGEIIYTLNGTEVARVNLVATEGVEQKKEKGFFDKLLSLFKP